MADGGSANCCKADTEGVAGKDGEAREAPDPRRRLRRYMPGWARTGGPSVAESFSCLVSGETIDLVTPLIKRHGLARAAAP
jgi:hypothetical protein